MPEIVYEKRWVTPSTAAEYVKNQIPNRSVSPIAVDKYARDMAAGDWAENGTVVCVNPDGKMNDGQHRCLAVIKAAKLVQEDRLLAEPVGYEDFEGIYLTFALNVSDEARATMDIGRKRTVADFMTLYGVEKANRIAPVVTWHLCWQHGNLIGANGSGIYRPTHQEIIAHWSSDEARFYTSTLRGLDATKQKLGGSAPFGMAYHSLRELVGDELVDTFWDRLLDGANLSKSDPILVLRNMLLTRRFVKHVQLALIFRAWNAWIDGRTVDTFFFKRPPSNSHFPLPRNPADKRNASPVLKDSAVG